MMGVSVSKTRPILLAMVLGLAACNNDDAVTPPSQDTETGAATSTGITTSAGTTTSGVDTTETASAGGTGTTSSGSDSGSSGSSSTGESSESTTGEPVVPGRTVSQLVSAGTRTSSPSYTLVHTLGQPSSLQSTHVSTSYRLQGGLVGANGSPP